MGNPITSVTVGLPARDAQQAKAWYAGLFGALGVLSPSAGVEELELTPGLWLQFMDDSGAEPPGHVLRIGVADLDAAVADLRAAGVEPEPEVRFPLAGGGEIRLAYVADPSGNRLCLYQAMEA
jgi:catechol 2,3-dioxygenase-like lactoylglutathione lyase family enzyme